MTPRYLFDENLSYKLARGFNAFADHRIVSVVDHPVLGRGTDDTEILRFCASENFVLVLNDWGIRNNPHEKAVYHQNGVGAFFFYLGKSKTPRFWKIVRIFAKYWQHVEERTRSNDPPFTFLVHKTKGISKL